MILYDIFRYVLVNADKDTNYWTFFVPDLPVLAKVRS